jgi:hypothetical protein
LVKAVPYCVVAGASNSAADKGSWARNASLRPRRTRSPIGRPEFQRPACDSVADADPRAQGLVRGFQPGGDVDRVAVGRVIEEAITAEIADQRGAGMYADPCDTEINAFPLPALAKCLRPLIDRLRAGDHTRSVVALIARRIEHHLDRITDHLGHCSFMGEGDICQTADIFVEQFRQHIRIGRLDQRCKASDR